MKTIIAALLISTSAFAFDNTQEDTYVSWCSDNQVVSQDREGNLVVIADCSQESSFLTCTEQVRPRGGAMIVTASCKLN